MKLGVFGDSFADVRWNDNGYNYNFAWPLLLEEMMGCKTDQHGFAGSSVFYSYEKFIQSYNNYTHVVFTYPSAFRWPYLHPDLCYSYAKHWLYISDAFIDTSKEIPEEDKEIFHSLHKLSRYITNDHLLTFISQNVVRNVNVICKENNIKLVNVFVRDNKLNEYNEKDLLFSSFKNLLHISKNVEKIVINNKITKDPMDLAGSDKCPDYRYCHLFEDNNKLLAKYVLDLFQKDEHIDAKEIKEWTVNDPKMNELYSKNLNST